MPKLVYIAHPLHNGDRIVKDNRMDAWQICKAIIRQYPDVMPISPLQAFGFMAQKDDERAREFCERLLRLCHEAWFFDSSPWVEDGRPWQESPGCLAEYNIAREWHIPCVEMIFTRGRVHAKLRQFVPNATVYPMDAEVKRLYPLPWEIYRSHCVHVNAGDEW